MRAYAWIVMCVWMLGCESKEPLGPGDTDADAAVPVSYAREVRPIFAKKCIRCHFTGAPLPRADLMDPFDAKRGVVGADNPWPKADKPILLVPGEPEESFLLDKVRDDNLDLATEGEPMPRVIPRLSEQELSDLRVWIESGATDDEHFAQTVKKMFREKCHDCHTDDAPQTPNLDRPFDPEVGIVNVLGDRKLLLIAPGDVDGSFLYQKVADENLPLALGAPMPLSVAPVTADEEAVLERWIREGAQRN